MYSISCSPLLSQINWVTTPPCKCMYMVWQNISMNFPRDVIKMLVTSWPYAFYPQHSGHFLMVNSLKVFWFFFFFLKQGMRSWSSWSFWTVHLFPISTPPLAPGSIAGPWFYRIISHSANNVKLFSSTPPNRTFFWEKPPLIYSRNAPLPNPLGPSLWLGNMLDELIKEVLESQRPEFKSLINKFINLWP